MWPMNSFSCFSIFKSFPIWVKISIISFKTAKRIHRPHTTSGVMWCHSRYHYSICNYVIRNNNKGLIEILYIQSNPSFFKMLPLRHVQLKMPIPHFLIPPMYLLTHLHLLPLLLSPYLNDLL